MTDTTNGQNLIDVGKKLTQNMERAKALQTNDLIPQVGSTSWQSSFARSVHNMHSHRSRQLHLEPVDPLSLE
jgi:hypothetical protein